MDVLNVNYNQDDIHLKKRDAYNLICQEIQSTYKGTLNPYHPEHMYFEFDKKNKMASYLSLSYQAMENGLQELDAINQQISLANKVFENPKADNSQHVPKIVELDDFDIEEMKVTKKNL
jgi:hypothetical protein